jgi:hypothetical protein
MKIERENYSIYPIIILTFGWVYYFIINYLNYIDFSSQFIDGILAPTARNGKYDTILFKLIAIGFGASSLFLNYKSKALNKKKIRILLSLLLLIMSIIAFPNLIWYYLI